MHTNFRIKDFREVELNGRLIDLHNNFNYQCGEYLVDQKILILTWEKSSESWVPKDELTRIQFTHKGVIFLFGFLESDTFGTEDSGCLSELTFYPSNDRYTNDHFLNQELPAEGDDLIYTFQDGKIIRVGCSDVTLSFLP